MNQNSCFPFLTGIVIFGAGVFLSLRIVAPITTDVSWMRAIVRGVIATLLGAAAVVALGLAQAVTDAANSDTYPFGYSLAPTINAAPVPQGVAMAFESALNPLIYWITPVVLAAVLLKVWLAARVSSVTAPAAVAARP